MTVPPHGGRSALGVVGFGTVVADQLAVTAPPEQPDRQRSTE